VRLGDVFQELVNPGRDIPVESIRVHGIVPDMIAGARRAGDVFDDFLKYLGHDILVAHYAGFDMHFTNMVMRRKYGFELQNLVLDTVRMCRSVILPSDPYGIERQSQLCSLDALAERFNIKVPERHTALGDVLATSLIFLRMISRLEKAGGETLKDLIRVALLK
jgi:DNA polymerase-3 subunit epsilon